MIFCTVGPNFHKFAEPVLINYCLLSCTLLVHPFSSHSYYVAVPSVLIVSCFVYADLSAS